MNQWHIRYQDSDYVYGTEPNVFLKDIYQKLKLKGNVLAIAEGEGRNAVYLAQNGLNVTAWDYAASGLAKTSKLAELKGVSVKTELVDLNDATWKNNEWDQLVCIFGHFPTDLRKKTLTSAKESIKPGGYFITEVYSVHQLSYQTGGPKDVGLLYTPDEFLQIFSDWRIVHFFVGEVKRNEGKLHNGLSHVIQFVGQKPER